MEGFRLHLKYHSIKYWEKSHGDFSIICITKCDYKMSRTKPKARAQMPSLSTFQPTHLTASTTKSTPEVLPQGQTWPSSQRTAPIIALEVNFLSRRGENG